MLYYATDDQCLLFIVFLFAGNDKQPVSILLELSKKRHWSDPYYAMVQEAGPAHLKTFLMSVTVNRVTYVPRFASANKKLAKHAAADECLRALGFF